MMSAEQRSGTVYAKRIHAAIGEAIDNRDWRTVWEMADELSAIAPRLMSMARDGAPPQRARATVNADEDSITAHGQPDGCTLPGE